MPNTYDYVCNCGDLNTNEFTAKEDILKIGKWDDTELTGESGGNVTNLYLGNDNKLKGTMAQAFNPSAKAFDLTRRGHIKSMYRQRDHHSFVEVPKNGK